ncbi:MAG: phosphoribosylaminoimidazolesuccinocarboxamide synthase [Gemmobacter sp.]
MARRKKIYEGKAKILYEGPEPGTLIQYFKDEAVVVPARAAQAPAGKAADAAPVVADGRGVLNNRLSEFFMSGLNAIGVPTHFIRRVNMREQLIRMAEIIPVHVVVRNHAAGGLTERLGIPEGSPLPRPIVEFYFKDDKLGDPLVSEEHIIAFGWASQHDLDDMVALALRVNDFLSGVMLGVGVRLADFRIEVGRIWEGDYMRLIVADEISPDNCRLWDLRTAEGTIREGGALRDPAPLADVYTELARRLGVLPSNVTHALKPTLIN